MEIIKFVANFDVNESRSWEIKQKLYHLQPVGKQNRFPSMLGPHVTKLILLSSHREFIRKQKTIYHMIWLSRKLHTYI